MMEGIGQPGQRHLTATEKVWRVRRVLCSSYNMSTLFRNLQKWCLASRKRDTLQTRYPLWSMVRLYVKQDMD